MISQQHISKANQLIIRPHLPPPPSPFNHIHLPNPPHSTPALPPPLRTIQIQPNSKNATIIKHTLDPLLPPNLSQRPRRTHPHRPIPLHPAILLLQRNQPTRQRRTITHDPFQRRAIVASAEHAALNDVAVAAVLIGADCFGGADGALVCDCLGTIAQNYDDDVVEPGMGDGGEGFGGGFEGGAGEADGEGVGC